MPVALMSWRPSAVYTVTDTLAGILAGIKAAVDAEVAANPATAMWMVADFSAPSGTLVLKNTAAGIAAGGSAARRLMLFGGSAPNTDAIDGHTSSTALLYCGVAPTANVDAPQQAYASGAPFTTGQWIPGGAFVTTFTGFNRIQYYETFAGVFIVSRKQFMTGGSGNLYNAILGQLGTTLDGETGRDLAYGSAGAWTTTVDQAAAGSGDPIPAVDPVGSTGYGRMNFGHPDDGVQRVRAAQRYANGIGPKVRAVDADRYFLPILLADCNADYCRLKLRQIAYGVRAAHDTSISDSGGIKAYKVAERSDASTEGPWLCQFRV